MKNKKSTQKKVKYLFILFLCISLIYFIYILFFVSPEPKPEPEPKSTNPSLQDFKDNKDKIYISINLNKKIFNEDFKNVQNPHITLLTISIIPNTMNKLFLKKKINKTIESVQSKNIQLSNFDKKYKLEEFGQPDNKFYVLNNIALNIDITKLRLNFIQNIVKDYLLIIDEDSGIYGIGDFKLCFLEKKAFGENGMKNIHITIGKKENIDPSLLEKEFVIFKNVKNKFFFFNKLDESK